MTYFRQGDAPWLVTALVKVRYLDQKIAKRPFRPSSQAATCYYQSNHSKTESIPLSALREREIKLTWWYYKTKQ